MASAAELEVFQDFGKMTRWEKVLVTVTEKIDGTNAQSQGFGVLTSRELFILSYVAEATENGDMGQAEDFGDLTVCRGLCAYGLLRRAFTLRRSCFKATKRGLAIWNEFRSEQERNGRKARS